MSQGRDSFGLAVSQRCLDRDPSRAMLHARQVKIHRPAVSNTPLTVPCFVQGAQQRRGLFHDSAADVQVVQVQMQMHAVRMLVRWARWGNCHAMEPGLCEQQSRHIKLQSVVMP